MSADLPRFGATASSDRSDANRSSRSPRSSPSSSSSSSEVLEIAESVTGAGRLCPFSLEIWVLTLNPFVYHLIDYHSSLNKKEDVFPIRFLKSYLLKIGIK